MYLYLSYAALLLAQSRTLIYALKIPNEGSLFTEPAILLNGTLPTLGGTANSAGDYPYNCVEKAGVPTPSYFSCLDAIDTWAAGHVQDTQSILIARRNGPSAATFRTVPWRWISCKNRAGG